MPWVGNPPKIQNQELFLANQANSHLTGECYQDQAFPDCARAGLGRKGSTQVLGAISHVSVLSNAMMD